MFYFFLRTRLPVPRAMPCVRLLRPAPSVQNRSKVFFPKGNWSPQPCRRWSCSRCKLTHWLEWNLIIMNGQRRTASGVSGGLALSILFLVFISCSRAVLWKSPSSSPAKPENLGFLAQSHTEWSTAAQVFQLSFSRVKVMFFVLWLQGLFKWLWPLAHSAGVLVFQHTLSLSWTPSTTMAKFIRKAFFFLVDHKRHLTR